MPWIVLPVIDFYTGEPQWRFHYNALYFSNICLAMYFDDEKELYEWELNCILWYCIVFHVLMMIMVMKKSCNGSKAWVHLVILITTIWYKYKSALIHFWEKQLNFYTNQFWFVEEELYEWEQGEGWERVVKCGKLHLSHPAIQISFDTFLRNIILYKYKSTLIHFWEI